MGGMVGMGEACLMGPDVNLTFRIEKAAAGLGVAFSFTNAAKALLAPPLMLELVPGRHVLKGFPGDCELFQLAGEGRES